MSYQKWQVWWHCMTANFRFSKTFDHFWHFKRFFVYSKCKSSLRLYFWFSNTVSNVKKKFDFLDHSVKLNFFPSEKKLKIMHVIFVCFSFLKSSLFLVCICLYHICVNIFIYMCIVCVSFGCNLLLPPFDLPGRILLLQIQQFRQQRRQVWLCQLWHPGDISSSSSNSCSNL